MAKQVAMVDDGGSRKSRADGGRSIGGSFGGPQMLVGGKVTSIQPPTPKPSAPNITVPDMGGGDMGGGGGYGGGGGATAAAAAAPIKIPTLDQFISGDFGYNQTKQENDRRLNDFDAETLRGRQTTEADQNMRRTALQQVLQDAGGDWASDSANRGLLRSGLYQQGQDRFVDQRGVQGNQDIDQILTQFIQQRGSARVDQEAQGRSALNDVLSQLSQRYNQQYVQPGAMA